MKRGLVEAPELWRWSSFRAYAYQERGLVRVNDWSVQELKVRKPTTFPSHDTHPGLEKRETRGTAHIEKDNYPEGHPKGYIVLVHRPQNENPD